MVAWPPIRFLLALSIIKSQHTCQIDFRLACPQADAECDLYMEVPKGFEAVENSRQFCLQIIKKIYGQKQAGCTGRSTTIKEGYAVYWVYSKCCR